MSRDTPHELLVAYDIADPKRLNRIHRCMCRWGLALQYSVFYCVLTPRDRHRMENDLRKLMDERRDDIRVYGIQSLHDIQFIGRKPLPDGLTVLAGGAVL